MKPRLLVVQNAEWEGPGLIGLHARAAGVDLEVIELFRSPSKSVDLPFDEVAKGSFFAAVGLGSPSTAYLPESNPHHDDLVRLFRLLRRSKIPSFNICYSMQLFSIAHGGKVVRNPKGKEVGFHKIHPSDEGKSDRVIGSLGSYTTLQWHGDIVEELPKGAVRLASSSMTKNQVAVLDGIHYLVQADGQAATSEMVKDWLRHDSRWATHGTGVTARGLVSQVQMHEAAYRNTFLRMFGNFLSLAI